MPADYTSRIFKKDKKCSLQLQPSMSIWCENNNTLLIKKIGELFLKYLLFLTYNN